MALFTTLYSGSSGNCAFIKENNSALLIDVGKNCKTTINALYSISESVSSICGILITHEHIDHISGLKVLLKHYNIPVFASSSTLQRLIHKDLIPNGSKLVEVSENQKHIIKDFEVTPFGASHDVPCVGYYISSCKGKSLAVATDLGLVSEQAYSYLEKADLVALEANYDDVMLSNGPYPIYLKNRIRSKYGHLSNTDSAEVVSRLIKSGHTRFAMCHLSSNNNTTNHVKEAITSELERQHISGKDAVIQISKRSEVSSLIEF